ncbi:wall-associated receptor kinase-like 1 [Bidens hawaiensis]|uniref:wall-associated receptor kinase-like 1 n=1 Tax=Bidens hawaiensis TaxID=980011 RepID=UPI00404936C8
MKLFQAYQFLIFLSLAAAPGAVPKYSKPGCNDTCGSVRIPYPFGIGTNCSVNQWYIIDCNSSKPYLSALNHLEVLGINLEDQIVSLNTPKISDCQIPNRNSSQTMSIDLGRSPFLFSKSHNKFVVEGCGNAVMMDHGSALTGCSTSCRNDTVSDKSSCLGVTCCETIIPHHLKSYTINLTGMERQGGDGACRSALLVDKNSYVANDTSFIPVSLLWTLADHDKDHVNCCSSYRSQETLRVDIGNSNTIDTWKCSYDAPFVGTSYLADGCNATEECVRCEGDKGECLYTRIYDVDGLAKEWNFTCFHIPSYSGGSFMAVTISIIVGIIITSGLGLIAIIYTSYKLIKKAITKRRRKSIFKRINGGLLLKQQEEIDPSLVNKTILFTSRELTKATNNFNENRILGKGGQGTVYKGMLADGRIVAVKKSKLVDESQLEHFINEVVILSQVNHRNVVKLLGCCLETEVPLLVSEYIPNGTLSDRIHEESHEFPLSLNMRLQIATEVAQALAYLHSATSIPIYHRDIKTTNILLDDKYRAKISDFGTSRFLSIDQTHLTTLVKGTFGYLDPEYFQSSQFTDKSDVYSFGVVMVELLTGERPISLTRFGENRSLVAHFILAMEEGRVMSIFESLVIKEGSRDELLVLANLAMRCLDPIGRNRPTMKEVATDLETIRTSHIPSMVQTNIEQVMNSEEISMLTYGESTSAFLSFNDRITQ